MYARPRLVHARRRTLYLLFSDILTKPMIHSRSYDCPPSIGHDTTFSFPPSCWLMPHSACAQIGVGSKYALLGCPPSPSSGDNRLPMGPETRSPSCKRQDHAAPPPHRLVNGAIGVGRVRIRISLARIGSHKIVEINSFAQVQAAINNIDGSFSRPPRV